MNTLIFKIVEKSVSNATGIPDIKIKNQKEEFVNAKRVFIQLLLDNDFFPTATSVAKYLELTHSTVLHHKKTNQWLLQSQQRLKSTYHKSKKDFKKIMIDLQLIAYPNNEELLARIKYHKEIADLLSNQLMVNLG
ncbi:hypothetical protein ACOSP6_10925 [Tenacibaculum sp. MEBiC06402]|uniref:hypothetical protein n=1 Tax=unclassified Tenacibaculum TaxID=2635139 RepID=UPI003B9A2A77